MEYTYTVVLTEAENKALAHVALDPEEWIVNAAKERAKVAMEEIFQSEIEKIIEDPNTTHISADREQVVLDANIESAADREKKDKKPAGLT